MSGRPRVGVLVGAVVVAVGLGVAWPVVGFASSSGTAAVLASATLTDATGDSGSGPDVTTVQISDDEAGKISFTAQIPNRKTLTDQDGIAAFFDVDRNSGSGGKGGFEYEVGWISGEQVLLHWDGSQFAPATAASFSASYKDGVASFSINKDDFGGSVAFNLIMSTTGDTGDSVADRAPDGSAVWGYPSNSSPPPPPPPPPGSPPPPPPPPSGVKLIATGFTVSKPHSGRKVTAAMVVRVEETGIAVKTAVSCTARLSGKPLKATQRGSVRSGRASCTWKLPKKSKGKQLRGSITATYQRAKVTKVFSKKVLS